LSVSESARVNTAAEYRFRVAAPNSRQRTASLVALDAASAPTVAHAVAQAPERRRIVKLTPTGDAELPAWLKSLPGQSRALIDDVEQSDMVVMVAQAGYAGHAATLLGEACRLRGVTVTALVIAPSDVDNADLSATLAQLRPFATMIVVASGLDYVEDMLQALRA
jgi:hypothetical protein